MPTEIFRGQNISGVKTWKSLKDGHTVGQSTSSEGMVFGANAGGGTNDWDALDTLLNNPTGAKSGGINNGLGIRRTYDFTWGPWSATSGPGDITRGVASFMSTSNPTITNMNNGSTDSAITTFFNSIPAGHTCFVVWKHEADNGGKVEGGDFAGFRTGQAHLHDLLMASNADTSKVKVGPLLTAGPYRDHSYANYYPTDTTKYDFIGIDTYEYWRPPGSPPDPKSGGLGQQRTAQYLVNTLSGGNTGTPTDGFEALHAASGKPPLVGEYAAHPFPLNTASRPNRMTAAVAYYDSFNGLGFCYFHYGTAGSSESGPWYLDEFHFNTGDGVNQAGATDTATPIAARNILSTRGTYV